MHVCMVRVVVVVPMVTAGMRGDWVIHLILKGSSYSAVPPSLSRALFLSDVCAVRAPAGEHQAVGWARHTPYAGGHQRHAVRTQTLRGGRGNRGRTRCLSASPVEGKHP